jgi:hypothetical protein
MLPFVVMMAWRIPRWLLPAALWGVVAITSADVVLLRHHPVKKAPRVNVEPIGLHVAAEGPSVRIQWNRNSAPVRNADRATLFITDGASREAVNLSGTQLDRSTVRYWPESEQVTFRLEVHKGDRNNSDSASIGLPQEGRRRSRQPRTERVVVEQARPSPFERVTPEIEVTQARRAPVITVSAPEPAVAAAPQEDGRFERVLSKIPLLRRFGKHLSADETEPRP